jgi:hypothetical protein
LPDPTNLDECFTILKTLDGLHAFQNTREEDLYVYHHTIGTYIRNKWQLWNPNSPLANYFREKLIWHADDMSNIILTSFHRHLWGKAIDLEDQIRYHIDYWKNQGLGFGGTTL